MGRGLVVILFSFHLGAKIKHLLLDLLLYRQKLHPYLRLGLKTAM